MADHAKSLWNTLVEARNALGDPIYSAVLPSIIKAWQQENQDPLIASVLAGETTLEAAFGPLAEANSAIDHRLGTTSSFKDVAEKTGTAFRRILSLTDTNQSYWTSLTNPVDIWRKNYFYQLRISLSAFVPASVLMWAMLTYLAHTPMLAPYWWAAILLGVAMAGLPAWPMTRSAGAEVRRRKQAIPRVRGCVQMLDKLLTPLATT